MKWATVHRLQNRKAFAAGSAARIRGLENLLCLDLGLTPQALCFRLLRRLRSHFLCKHSVEVLKRHLPILRYQIFTVALVPVLLNQAKTRVFVDVTSRVEYAVGP